MINALVVVLLGEKMNKYRLPTSTYDRKNDKEVTDEDIKRNFKGQSDILIQQLLK